MNSASTSRPQSNVVDFVARCSGALLDFLPASNAAFYVLDESLRPAACHSLRTTPSAQLQTYMDHLWQLDPLLPTPETLPTEQVRSLRTASVATCAASAPYVHFIENEGCVDTLRVDLRYAGKIVGGLALGRHAGEGPFKQTDLELLRKCSRLLDTAATYSTEPSPSSEEFEQRLAPFRLTVREVDIVKLLREGVPNKRIAGNLGIELATVKSHIINIFRKTGVNSRTALLAAIYF